MQGTVSPPAPVAAWSPLLDVYFPLVAASLLASTVSAHAVDEIQVYNAEIAEVGQWTQQLHAVEKSTDGSKSPRKPGGRMTSLAQP